MPPKMAEFVLEPPLTTEAIHIEPQIWPKAKWRWNFCGDSGPNFLMIIETPMDVSWWRRFITRLVLGSKWTRLP